MGRLRKLPITRKSQMFSESVINMGNLRCRDLRDHIYDVLGLTQTAIEETPFKKIKFEEGPAEIFKLVFVQGIAFRKTRAIYREWRGLGSIIQVPSCLPGPTV